MYALNLTPHPVTGSVIAGKWRITTCKVKLSDWGAQDIVYYRADNFSAILKLLSSMTDSSSPERVPVKVEIVGVYYYELYFDLEDGIDDLPFDLSVFLHCLY